MCITFTTFDRPSLEGDIMTSVEDRQHRSFLRKIAHRAMLSRGLLPDFSPEALADLDRIHGPATRAEESTHDLRNLIWCSIDNDDSRDLDRLTVAEAMPGGTAKILVAIADVDAVVKKQSASVLLVESFDDFGESFLFFIRTAYRASGKSAFFSSQGLAHNLLYK